MKFTDFTLNSELQEGLADAGYITCMPVQEQVLKNGLEGSDLYVQSQTGTGKTAAYLLIILQRLISDPALAGKKALIMVPTRELAVQVEEEARILCSHMKLKSASFYGGVGYGGQQELLARGVDVIIGTPGRVIDLQQSGTMKLNEVAFLVIDEADRMFDMGFYPDLRVLIKVLPKAENRQTMLFSATLNSWVKNLAWEYTINAKEVTIEAENVTVTEIEQILYHVPSEDKMRLLLGILKNENPESLIIFCNTKRMSEVVAKRLKINGYEADFIIGDLPQSKRLQVIDSFKSKSLKCLVATDVAARGIDVNDLAMVINYDLPNEAENYVHRTGRTARAGKTGKAYTFCSEQDVYNLPSIQKYIEAKLESSVASEDMMVEDKSAHMYIRTDRYDNDYADEDTGRNGSRGRPASNRSGPGRSSPGSRGGPGRGRPSSGTSRDSGRSDNRAPGSAPARPNSAHGSFGDKQPRDIRISASEKQPLDNRSPAYDNQSRNDGRGRGQSSTGQSSTGRSTNGRSSAGGFRPQTAERDLSKLSFDDRMAYYKNKYGSEEAAKAANDQNQSAESRNRFDSGKPAGAKPAAGAGTPAPRNQRAGKPAAGAGTPVAGTPATRQSENRSRSGQSGTRSNKGYNPRNQGQRQPNPTNAARASQTTAKPSQSKTGTPSAAQKKPSGLGGFIKKLFGGK